MIRKRSGNFHAARARRWREFLLRQDACCHRAGSASSRSMPNECRISNGSFDCGAVSTGSNLMLPTTLARSRATPIAVQRSTSSGSCTQTRSRLRKIGATKATEAAKATLRARREARVDQADRNAAGARHCGQVRPDFRFDQDHSHRLDEGKSATHDRPEIERIVEGVIHGGASRSAIAYPVVVVVVRAHSK